jgi:hypothetical protein
MSTEHSPGAVLFESTVPWHAEHADKLVIHCSDSRYHTHIDEFLRTRLKIGAYDRLVVPGGPQFFLAASYLPKFEWAGRRWARYLARRHGIREIFCITHEDCGWYKEVTIGPFTLSSLKNRQLDDLRKVRGVLQEMFPEVPVRLFYAHPSPKGHVEFVDV